ncbi:uncharacterized protein B0T23DRAFT_397261 [Neurospora hispaniola]|uniref:Uncharacterized protein n=1 Tax=Neurospora hispaniola TaxID=588809 RepID=A0AAJ0MR89_9PEZI|nr:hypothetical protein B0T23DRAFT_397261 [Neurospora hispaniola]
MSFTLPRFKLGKSAKKKTDRDGNGSASHDGKHHSIDVLLHHDLKQLSKLRAEQLEGYSKEDLESLPLDRRQVLPAEVLSTLNPRALNQLPGKTIAKLSTAAQITLSPWTLARIPISSLATIDLEVLFCALPVLGSDDLRVLKKAIHRIGHDKLRQLPPDVIRRLPFELPSEPLQLPLQWRESSMISPEKSLPPDPPQTSTHSLGVPSEYLYSDARHDQPSYEQPSVVPSNAHYNPANVDTSIFTSPPSPAHTVPGRSSPNTVRSSATVQATAYPPRASDHRLSYAPRRNSSVSRGSHIRARSSSRGPRPDRNQEYQAYTPGSVKFAELSPIEFADLSRDVSELGPSTPPPRSSSRLDSLSVSEHIKRAESWNDKPQEFPRTETPKESREIIPKEDSRSMSPTSTSASSSPDVASFAKRKLRAAQGNISSSANDDADPNYKHQVIQDHTISELKAENKRLHDQLIDAKADHKALLNRLTKYLDDKCHSKRHTGDPIGVVIAYCEELCKERRKIAKENKDWEDTYLREKMHRQEVEDLVDEKSGQLRAAEDDLLGLQSKVKEYSRRASELEARESSLRNDLSRLERENKELHKRCENQKELSDAAIKRIQRESDQTAADHVSQLRAQKEGYAKTMQDQRMYYEGQVKSLHHQLADQTQSHETQLAQATKDLQDAITNLRSQHTEELNRMESAFSEQVAGLQTAHSQQIAAQQKKHEQDIQRLNKKHARNVVDLREKVQSLENDLVGNNDDFRPATDDSLKIQYRQLKLCIDMVTEPINLGITGVPRNLGKLDPTRFLEREGKNQLRFLLRSVVWQKIVEGFFSEPFGFGALGNGEGREVLRGVVEGWRGLCGYDDRSLSNGKMASRSTTTDTDLLTPFFHSREANKWRSATFQSILMTVAPPSSMSGSTRKGQQAGAPSPRGTPGPPEHPTATPYYTNINQVQSQIVALLSSICSEPLSSEVQSKVSELARQAGELALQFGAQRAQLGLEVPKRGEQVKIGTESGWVDCEDGDSFGGRRGVEVEVDLCVSPKVYRVGDMDGRNIGDKKTAKVKAIVAGEVYPRRS